MYVQVHYGQLLLCTGQFCYSFFLRRKSRIQSIGSVCYLLNKVLGDTIEKATSDVHHEIITSTAHVLSKTQIHEMFIVGRSP